MAEFRDSFRLKVLKAVSACLAAIEPEPEGYQHDFRPTADVPVRVFRGRKFFGDNDPLPMVCILETPIPLEPISSPYDATETAGGFALTVQGFCEDDPLHPTDPAHILMADVKLALAREKAKAARPGGYIFGMREITGLEIGQGTVQAPDEVSSKAYFVLSLVVHMSEDLADPYA